MAVILSDDDSPSAFTNMVVLCSPASSLLRSICTFTALLLSMAVVPDMGSTFTQSTSMPVIFQSTLPALPIFFMSKESVLYSEPKFRDLVFNSILELFFSASAVILSGCDSLSVLIIMVVSLCSVMRLRFNVTTTALLLPASIVPLEGLMLSQSTSFSSLMFQFILLLPLLYMLNGRDELLLPKSNVFVLNSKTPSSMMGVSWMSPDAS